MDPSVSGNLTSEKDLSILVVDDDFEFADAQAELLENNGYVVRIAQNRAQALDTVAQVPLKVALIDLRLGEDSGLDLIEELKLQQPHILCMIITAYADIKAVVEALRRGACDFLDKNMDPAEELRILSKNLNKQKQQQLNEAAVRANQEKTEFLSRMSHELRTPMNAIIGFSQLLELEQDPPLSSGQLDFVKEISKAGNHLLDLINEVLDLAKIEAGHIGFSIEAVAVSEVIDESLPLITAMVKKRGIEVSFIWDGVEINIEQLLKKSCAVRADRTRLKQALLNILSNAVKYNSENGKLIIACERTEKNIIRISIADTGNGLAPEQHQQLFKPFERLGAEQTEIEGTGIGLVITKNLVELMGGSIGAKSQAGEGSTFWIDLPEDSVDQLQINVLDEKSAPQSQILGNSKQQHTVLYVEDNPVNLKLVDKLLCKLPNVHMWSTHKPSMGFELAMKHIPDLILLDINLPEINGFEVLKKIQQHPATRKIPVVAISSNAMPKDIKKAREAGFADYLTKPFDATNFFNIVNHYLLLKEENQQKHASIERTVPTI